MTIFAQILGIFGLILTVISFQTKQQKVLIGIQFYSCMIFTVHFWLLGAAMGCILNAICILRAFVFSRKDRIWAQWKGWPVVFIAAYCAAYALNFLILGTEPTAFKLIIELLPTLGIVVGTVGFAMKKAFHVRIACLICSPMWLVYNIINGSVGGTLTEIISLISIVTGILRLDLKRKDSVS